MEQLNTKILKYQSLKPTTICEQLLDVGWKRCKPNYFIYDKFWNRGVSYSLHIEDEWIDGAEFRFEYPITIHINCDTVVSFNRVFRGEIENNQQLINTLKPFSGE